MFANNIIVSVLVNEEICRENGGQVYLPFGTEYSLQIKNLDARRAFVKISVDGEDVLDNTSVVINGNSTTEIKGVLKGNIAHNRFKFIQLTDKIRDHKGDRPDWGIIRVLVQFEQVYRSPPIVRWKEYTDHWVQPKCPPFGESNISYKSCNSTLRSSNSVSSAGLTVPGSVVDQNFASTNLRGTLVDGPTISLQLVGQRPDNQPVKAVRTARRVSCPTCGLSQKGNAKYCSECATCLL